jgi:hypothetical protein
MFNRGDNPDLLGYSTGTRWDRTPKERAVHIGVGQSPEEEAETRRHEYTHEAVDLSPNWSYIMQLQQPTPELHQEMGLTYPKALELEENMIRHLGDKSPSNEEWRNVKGGLSPVQKQLLSYLKSFTQYGPQWGSFVGPEYDERELRQGKGQNILPKFVFAPRPEDMKIIGMPRKEQSASLSDRIALEEKAGYDLGGYLKKYGLDKNFQKYMGGEGHLTDEFKLPNHITFSDESVYSNDKTPGGKWKLEKDGKWHYTPSDYVLSVHPPEELQKYFEEREPESVLELPKSAIADETTRDMYSPRWRDIVR